MTWNREWQEMAVALWWSDMARTGRPSTFTPAVVDAICEHIAQGKSLVSWSEVEGNAGYTTVMRWLRESEDFRNKYACAREAQADYLAEQIIQISDDGANDTYTDGEGNERTNQDVIARSRLRVDARKWYASKLAPKKYGEKVETTLTGAIDHSLQVTFIGAK